MAWSPSRSPACLARFYVIEQMLLEPISLLTAAITNNPDTAYIISKFGAVKTANVDIGDLEAMPPITSGWLQLRVEGAGRGDSMDAMSHMVHINAGNRDTFFTSIFAYLHPDAFLAQGKILQARQRATALMIVSGWLRSRVLNYVGPLIDTTFVNRRVLTLASREKDEDADDVLSDCIAVEGHTGTFVRQYTGETLFGVEFKHVGFLQ